jgi:hypothetical protein
VASAAAANQATGQFVPYEFDDAGGGYAWQSLSIAV